jgi:4-aminobutyrate aminotransferase
MRPVDLAIIDGIESMNNGENSGRPEDYVKPHLLVAGRNVVCVDAVGAAAMGFDPMADRGTAPFERADSTLRLAEELRTVVPPALDTYFFTNSGAEAIEGAVKLARHATRRPNVIVFQGSFHGRTNATMAMTTSKTIYRAGYQPLTPGVFVAPYPYAYRYGWDEETTLRFCLRELKLLLKSQTAPEETAAIVIEPVLGEGGYVVPPDGFLPALRELCDHYGILLVADEVQSRP